MFTYTELKIISAVPLTEILEYFRGLGAVDTGYKASLTEGLLFNYNDMEIKITGYHDPALPELGIKRYQIELRGERAAAEEFLTAYRFHFLSAGG